MLLCINSSIYTLEISLDRLKPFVALEELFSQKEENDYSSVSSLFFVKPLLIMVCCFDSLY